VSETQTGACRVWAFRSILESGFWRFARGVRGWTHGAAPAADRLCEAVCPWCAGCRCRTGEVAVGSVPSSTAIRVTFTMSPTERCVDLVRAGECIVV
jgi:hypothetical protein